MPFLLPDQLRQSTEVAEETESTFHFATIFSHSFNALMLFDRDIPHMENLPLQSPVFLFEHNIGRYISDLYNTLLQNNLECSQCASRTSRRHLAVGPECVGLEMIGRAFQADNP